MSPPGPGDPRASAGPAAWDVAVCSGPQCGDRGGEAGLWQAFERALRAAGLEDRCRLRWQPCLGRCSHGPNVVIRRVGPAPAGAPPPATLYSAVDARRVEELVARHLRRDPANPPPPDTE